MENTIKNKKKFFSLYWGQEVYSKLGGQGFKRGFVKSWLFRDESLIDGFLLLKPLNKISDEDLEVIKEIKSELIDDLVKYFPIADYLRSKGYALPYMDLSVSDLLEYKWIKIDENE